MGQSPQQMSQTMIDNLPARTGKSLQQWLKTLDNTRLVRHGEVVKHLISEHSVTHGFASLIAQQWLAAGDIPVAGEDLVALQYKGPQEGLRPITTLSHKDVNAELKPWLKKAYQAA